MFDLGMMELLVIGIVALIVVGPKDLPGMFRGVGKFVGKMKGMAREFQRSMDQAAQESGINEATSGLRDATSSLKSATDFNPLDFDKDLGKSKVTNPKKPSTPLSDEANLGDPVTKVEPEKKSGETGVAKKPATKKPAAKKPAAKKATPKKPAAKKPTAAKGK